MKRKIVTVCGSMKFLPLIQEVSEQLELEKGYAVIGIIPHVLDRPLTDEEADRLSALHRVKIDLADAVFIVNPGGYIGKSVRTEIEYARAAGKEVLFPENH